MIEEVLRVEFRGSRHKFFGIDPWVSSPIYDIEEFSNLLLDGGSGVRVISSANDIVNIRIAGEGVLRFTLGREEVVGSPDDDCPKDASSLAYSEQ